MKLLSDFAYSVIVFAFLYGITMTAFSQVPLDKQPIPEAQKKALAADIDRQKAVFSKQMSECKAIALKLPVRSPATVIEEQCAAYKGCLAGKGYTTQACFR